MGPRDVPQGRKANRAARLPQSSRVGGDPTPVNCTRLPVFSSRRAGWCNPNPVNCVQWGQSEVCGGVAHPRHKKARRKGDTRARAWRLRGSPHGVARGEEAVALASPTRRMSSASKVAAMPRGCGKTVAPRSTMSAGRLPDTTRVPWRHSLPKSIAGMRSRGIAWPTRARRAWQYVHHGHTQVVPVRGGGDRGLCGCSTGHGATVACAAAVSTCSDSDDSRKGSGGACSCVGGERGTVP